MIELAIFLKGFIGVIKSLAEVGINLFATLDSLNPGSNHLKGSDHLVLIDKNLERIASNFDALNIQVANIAKGLESIDRLVLAVSEIPETMRSLKIFGHEFEGAGHVISAWRALVAETPDDARDELIKAKNLAPSNWYVWVGFVWLHVLELNTGQIDVRVAPGIPDAKEERERALKKAIKYVCHCEELHETYKLSFLFTLLTIAHSYQADGLRAQTVNCIIMVLSAGQPREYKELLPFLKPINSHLLDLKEDGLKSSFKQLADASYGRLVESIEGKVKEYEIGQVESLFAEIQSAAELGEGLASDSLVGRVEELKAGLIQTALSRIDSEWSSSPRRDVSVECVRRFVNEMDRIFEKGQAAGEEQRQAIIQCLENIQDQLVGRLADLLSRDAAALFQGRSRDMGGTRKNIEDLSAFFAGRDAAAGLCRRLEELSNEAKYLEEFLPRLKALDSEIETGETRLHRGRFSMRDYFQPGRDKPKHWIVVLGILGVIAGYWGFDYLRARNFYSEFASVPIFAGLAGAAVLALAAVFFALGILWDLLQAAAGLARAVYFRISHKRELAEIEARLPGLSTERSGILAEIEKVSRKHPVNFPEASVS